MTTNKMLIDASHPEETRVVVLHDGRVEEFDYESTAREQLRGNIYLAKVTRVEPSLQAAFVDYGGNRHGFLAFSEIHPDYYQIPVADRKALLAEEADEQQQDAAEDDQSVDSAPSPHDDDGEHGAVADAATGKSKKGGRASSTKTKAENVDAAENKITEEAPDETAKPRERTFAEKYLAPILSGEYLTSALGGSDAAKDDEFRDVPEPHGLVEDRGIEEVNGDDNSDDGSGADDAAPVDEVGEGDVLEEVPPRRRRRKRHYKIQEVIKRGQIILVQVVKEERGNKGAALTTYMSLAGRYTVLMPNTARGGGISRKITNATDRNHLRKIATALEVPEGMGLIIRTAGSARTKIQINRDFEYLLRLWEKVRDLTLTSIAPCRVYEEGDLIKRSIRDLYSKDIDEVVVSGENSYREAKDFMRMIMPSHAKNVKQYKDSKPLFTKYDIERQLAAMFSPYVTLPSGGYLVINQTEALVAIDINSGKSTREFSIEETALKTNLEASEEIARQLKLRDLAGLIVIDYIDMEERSNNRAVERRLKSSLQGDRARIQIGRISHFGLLEMSRQRLRTGVLEGSTSQCSQCQGTGIIRSTDSVALSVLRALEDALISGQKGGLRANTSVDVALYILNSKRDSLNEIEQRYGVEIDISANEKLQGGNFSIETTGSAEDGGGQVIMTMNWGAEAPDSGRGGRGRGRGDQKGRKRGGRKRGKDAAQSPRGKAPQARRAKPAAPKKAEEVNDDPVEDVVVEAGSTAENDDDGQGAKKPRRRGRRGGRRNRGRRTGSEATGEATGSEATNGEATGEATGGEDTGGEANTGEARSDASGDANTGEATSGKASNGDAAAETSAAASTGSGRRRRPKAESTASSGEQSTEAKSKPDSKSKDAGEGSDSGETKAEAKPARPRRRRAPSARKSTGNGDATKDAADPTSAKPRKSPKAATDDKAPAPAKAETKKPARAKPARKKTVSASSADSSASAPADAPAKSGWWQKRD